MKQDKPEATLDQEKKAEICAVVRLGCSRATAAKRTGCTVADIRREAQRDPQFAARLGAAESDLEIAHMRNVFEASKETKNWRVSVWALERIHPARYARRGPDVVTSEQLARFVRVFTEIILEEIPDKTHQRNIVSRVGRLLTQLRRQSDQREEGEGDLEQPTVEPH